MPDYIVFIRTDTSSDYRFLTAPDLATARSRIRAAVARGLSVNNQGVNEQMRIGIVQLEDFATLDPEGE